MNLRKYWQRKFSERARRYAEIIRMAYSSPFVWRHAFEKRYEVIRSFLKKYLPHIEGRKILDAGCGPGLYLSTLFNNTFSVGLDISEDIIRHLHQRNRDIPVVQGDITATCFRDEFFDAVLCVEVFQYLDASYVKKTVEEFARVLRRGGYVLITTLNPDFFVRNLGRVKRESSWGFEELSDLLGSRFRILEDGFIVVLPDWGRLLEMVIERCPRRIVKYFSTAIFVVAEPKT